MVSSDGGSKTTTAYKMTSPHGIALIISNIEFDKTCGLDYRAGAHVDEKSLQELFSPKYLNYMQGNTSEEPYRRADRCDPSLGLRP